jgi:hypothetical protein
MIYFIIGLIFSFLGFVALLTGSVIGFGRHNFYEYSSAKDPKMFWVCVVMNFFVAGYCFYRVIKQRGK